MSGELHPSWHHQLKAKAFIHHLWDTGHPGALAAVCLGGGKSKITIDLINDLIEECGLSLVLIVAPLRIVDVWEFQLQQHANFPYVFCGLDDRVDSVAAKTRAARDAIALAKASKQVCIIVVNYESSWREPFASWALNTAWPLVVAEECVPPGSLISTPHGEVPIENLRTGDAVYGYDHASNCVVETSIKTTFKHDTFAPLLAVHDARLTPEHPVWTANRGYVPAHTIKPSDEVLYLGQKNPPPYLRILRNVVPEQRTEKKILQPGLLWQGRHDHKRSPTTICRTDTPDTASTAPAEKECLRILPDGVFNAVPYPSFLQHELQIQSRSQEKRLPHADWGQRARPDQTTVIARTAAELANGMGSTDTDEEGLGLSDPLHDRYCRAIFADRNRSRWPVPPCPSNTREGCQKGCLPDITGMVGAAILEPGNPGRPEPGRKPHPVHNLETGTGNYFVNGLLVHNCHRIKSPNGRASRFMGRLSMRAARRLGLSGTPLPHSPLDIWAQYRFLDPSIYESTFSSFKTHYAEWGGFQNREVKKWRDMENFNARLYTIAFRVTKEEALDLPPEMDQTLRCELTREGRAVYDRLENDFVAWLGETPEEQITVQNALVLLLRLQQLTGGTLRDDSGEEHVVDTAKESALAEWLEDLDPKEPAVIFANFTADLDAIRRASERAGHTCAEVSGRSPDGIATWKAGRANILAAQIRIASEGQDFTRAAYCCYYSLGFSLLHYIQSRARIHRPGQTRPVTYYHLLATNTIDEIVLRAVQNRWELVESVLKEMKKHVPRLVR